MARGLVTAASRGALSKQDEAILAPVWKLPPDVRAPLAHVWSKPRFFEALGSRIGSISVSAAQVLEATAAGFGDLPLITISRPILVTTACGSRMRCAARSTRGRHIRASNSGHWIPLDQPDVVIDAVKEILQAGRNAEKE